MKVALSQLDSDKTASGALALFGPRSPEAEQALLAALDSADAAVLFLSTPAPSNPRVRQLLESLDDRGHDLLKVLLLRHFFSGSDRIRRVSVVLVREVLAGMTGRMPHAVLMMIVTTVLTRMGSVSMENAAITMGSNTTAHERAGIGRAGANARGAPLPDNTAADSSSSGETELGGLKFPPAKRDKQLTIPHSGEQSDDVRALLLSLVHTLLHCCSSNRDLGASPLFEWTCGILYSALQIETAPGARLLTCACLEQFALDYPRELGDTHNGHKFSLMLLVPLMQRSFLLNKNPHVRIAAIQATHRLVPCGAAELIRDLAAFVERNVIDIAAFFGSASGDFRGRVNFFARLVADENWKVRQAFFRMLQDWAMTLSERADYETLIMSYVYTGLSDSQPAIQAETKAMLERHGVEYEREEMERVGAGIGGTVSDQGKFRLDRDAEEHARAVLSELPLLVFPPFTARPSWGTRQVGFKFLDRLHGAIVGELLDWKSDVVANSWKLLRMLLMLTEEHATRFLTELVDVFAKEPPESLAANSEARRARLDCIALLARYTHPGRLLENLSRVLATARDRCTALRLIAASLPFMAYTHPEFASSLSLFLDRSLLDNAEDDSETPAYLSQESSVFAAYVDVAAAVLRLQDKGLDHAWHARHDRALFRMMVEIASWSRRSGGTGSAGARSAEARAAHASLLGTIDECYMLLLQQVDAESAEQSDFLTLFQLYLRPIVQTWVSKHAVPAEWTPATLQLCMLVEVMSKAGGGLFVKLSPEAAATLDAAAALPATSSSLSASHSAAPDAASSCVVATAASSAPPLTDPQQISLCLQQVLLWLLESNPRLEVHAMVLVPLGGCLACETSSFAPAFLERLASALEQRLQSFSWEHAALSASLPSDSSLRALPRAEELRLQQMRAHVEAQRRLFAVYAAGLVSCVTAMRRRGFAAQDGLNNEESARLFTQACEAAAASSGSNSSS